MQQVMDEIDGLPIHRRRATVEGSEQLSLRMPTVISRRLRKASRVSGYSMGSIVAGIVERHLDEYILSLPTPASRE